MKQHISQLQLEELSKKEKNKLEEWCVSKDYNLGFSVFNKKEPILPSLSIGQMIDFLGWDWDIYAQLDPDYTSNENICDVLWEAVKSLLKE